MTTTNRKPPKATKKRKPARVRKQTSDRVSRIAARMLRRWEQAKKDFDDTPKDSIGLADDIKWGDVVALAASCLSQDEQKGKRAK